MWWVMNTFRLSLINLTHDKPEKALMRLFFVDNKHSLCDTNLVSTTTQDIYHAYYQARPKQNGNNTNTDHIAENTAVLTRAKRR